ncbi:MAG: hypothetical protein KDI37_01770, partial [Xanthomonadales bacterium]|nr:hypothetical protein [Xanthomonadales bacterium]
MLIMSAGPADRAQISGHKKRRRAPFRYGLRVRVQILVVLMSHTPGSCQSLQFAAFFVVGATGIEPVT